MRHINFAMISDTFFTAACAFALSFTVLRFYVRKLWLTATLAALFAVAAGAAAFFFMLKKRRKKLSLSRGDRQAKTLSKYLATLPDKVCAELFAKALNGTYCGGNLIELPQGYAAVRFRMRPLEEDDVAALLRSGAPRGTSLYCAEAGDGAATFAEECGIKILTAPSAFKALEESGNLPNLPLSEKRGKRLEKLRKRFKRRLFPSLFFSGLSLLGFSFITFYPVYYIVTGGVLLALSALSLLIGQSS